jgi:hypothetical protein
MTRILKEYSFFFAYIWVFFLLKGGLILIALGVVGAEFGFNELLRVAQFSIESSKNIYGNIDDNVKNLYIIECSMTSSNILLTALYCNYVIRYSNLGYGGEILVNTVEELRRSCRTIFKLTSVTDVLTLTWFIGSNHLSVYENINSILYCAICPAIYPGMMVIIAQYGEKLTNHLSLSAIFFIHRMANIVITAGTIFILTYDFQSFYSIIIIIGGLIILYLIIDLFGKVRIFIATIVIFYVVAVDYFSSYKYRFPGIVRYTGQSQYLNPINMKSYLNTSHKQARNLPDPKDSLLDWKKNPRRKGQDKPTFIVISASGGGYRATFWTSLVLDYLIWKGKHDATFPDVTENVGLLTGASGGMVALAHFANNYRTPPQTAGCLTQDISEHLLNEQNKKNSNGCGYYQARSDYISNKSGSVEHKYESVDSLKPIMKQCMRDIKDIFLYTSSVSEGNFADDRGLALEKQWPDLGYTFPELNSGQKHPPTIIISPALVETGQPLLISNTKLGSLRSISDKRSMEFFAMFSDAVSTFKMTTAVRMSASFPYISPATDIPTTPSLRVVDAGFYDNYGITSAVEYLEMNDVKEWLLDNTSRVIIIQIRAFNTESEAYFDESGGFPHAPNWLFSPISTLLSVRKTATMSRNDRELDLVKKVYDDQCRRSRSCSFSPDLKHHFIETVVLQPSGTKSQQTVSWYLSHKELEEMSEEIFTFDEANSEFGRLKNLLAPLMRAN